MIPTFLVIPAQAGIQIKGPRGSSQAICVWIPACAGMTMMECGAPA